MNSKHPICNLKSLVGAIAGSAISLATLDVQAAVSQSPLSLTVGVPPNLILTLDDSGSMDRAYVPDSIPGGSGTRRYHAAYYNAMYYNPAVTYRIPPRFNSDGTPASPFTTSFTSARVNGFNAGRGTINLSTSYRPTWTYTVTSSSSNVGNNPAPEFYLSFDQSGVSLAAGATSGVYVRNGVSYRLTRAGSGSGCTVSVEYPENYPAIDCSRSSTTSTTYRLRITDRRNQNVPAYYYVYDTNMAGCTSVKTDENCYRKVDVSSSSGMLRADDPDAGTDERQNFAIWYSFYRARNLATVSAASLALAEMPASTRITWQGLTTCATLNSGSSCNGSDNRFREYNLAQRGRLFDWMQNMTFPGNTPLRLALDRAGKFLQTETAWQKFPNATGNTPDNVYACRPSYHILMTDGVWNSSNGSPSDTLRADHSSFTLPDGSNYSATRRPYADGTTNTLADLAMHYWATDLRGSLDNQLKPYYPFATGTAEQQYWNPRNNPASWQHMVNFTVGLGLTNSLSQPNLAWDNDQGTFGSEGYVNISNGTANWPAAASDSTNNVYDLWHAAINSRGEFFSADSPEAVVQAFTDIMSRIASRASTASRPAINSSQVTEDAVVGTKVTTVSYQTSYSSSDNWSGDLIRTEKERIFNAALGKYEDSFSTRWKASEQLPAPVARKIYVAGNNAASGLIPFTWANAGSGATPGTLAYYLSQNPEKGNALDSLGEARLNYLRGNRANEGTTFRTRSSVLGDLYSSTPVSVSRARYITTRGQKLAPTGDYKAFAASVLNRTPRVYVGGNAGMLHAFNAQTGVEEFAFIPSAVFPTLNKLTGQNYSHQFYVDGSPVVADVFDGSQWRTILVGTLRAGGKSVFALDITTPGAEKLLWEFDDSDIPAGNEVRMGYSFAKPTIAKLATGGWAVVFGNGYESTNHTNGKAALFVVDAINGNLLKSLEVAGTNGRANGLSTPKLSDYNDDGVAEFAYAGDLQGNLWRFNIYDSAANSFNVAYNGTPLFRAVAADDPNKAQPITSAPSLVRHATGRGYMVIFGTGKYFEDTDKDGDKSMAQTVYGIWDRYTRTVAVGTEDDPLLSSTALNISRSDLVEQEIQSQTSAVDVEGDTYKARIITEKSIPWTTSVGGVTTPNKWGWMLNLQLGTLDGEMVVDDMTAFGRRVLLFQSLVPNDDPCGDGATNWTYAINAHTGGRLPHNVFQLNTGNINDPYVSGKQQDGEGGLTVSQKPDGSYELCTGSTCSKILPDSLSVGRQTWRSIEETE